MRRSSRPGRNYAVPYHMGSKVLSAYDQYKPFMKDKLTESEVNLLMRRINSGKFKASDLWQANKRLYEGEGFDLTPDQIEKGRKWLYNQGYTPTGKEKENSPYGYREQEIVKNLKDIKMKDVYSERGNWYVPVYEASDGNTTMEYYVMGGKIHIVG